MPQQSLPAKDSVVRSQIYSGSHFGYDSVVGCGTASPCHTTTHNNVRVLIPRPNRADYSYTEQESRYVNL